MTARLRRLAALCAAVLPFLPGLSQGAFAGACRAIEDEQSEAEANGYRAVRDYAGTEARAFLRIFNRVSPPGIADVDAERLRILAARASPSSSSPS